MKARSLLVIFSIALAGLTFPKVLSNTNTVEAATTLPDAKTELMRVNYARLPLSFEANQGQTDRRVKFLSRGSGYTLFLTPTEAVLVLSNRQPEDLPGHLHQLPLLAQQKALASVLLMKLVGANAAPEVAGLEELPGRSNYFIGNDPKKWHRNVPTYSHVKYQGVYPGVDLVYYGNQRELEYDFIVSPGADPRSITLGFSPAEKLTINAQGDLVVSSKEAEIRLKKPVVYQQAGGSRQEVAGGYTLKDKDQVGFEIAAYDVAKPLVIDPALVYSTFLGGSSADFGERIAVDSTGNAYVTGETFSTNFPTTAGAFQTTAGSPNNNFDVFVTKFNATGSAPLVYSTYLGGIGGDVGHGIAVDASGNAYVTGGTASTNFPTTAGAFQTTFGGGAFCGGDAFVTKLDPTGSALVYSTYLGGSGADESFGIAVDASGNAYVTGFTGSTNFPTTAGAFQTTFGGGVGCVGAPPGGDAFVAKLNPTGSALVYSTYLGGSGVDAGSGIAVDAPGNAHITGLTLSSNFPTTPGAFQTTFGGGSGDAFVAKINPALSGPASLVYSTYLGGSGGDTGSGIAVDASGNAHVTGVTSSTNFPTTAGAFQTTIGGGFGNAFVAKINPALSGPASLVYSTYLGGSGSDTGSGIAVDALGNAYVTGFTSSTNFPTTLGAFQTTFGGSGDAFVAKLNPTGSAPLLYSTYLGGTGDDGGSGIAVDASGNAYVTGFTGSTNFPTTAGAFQTTFGGFFDAFVAKINPKGPIDLVNDLISAVASFNLQQGISNSLDAKLENAEDALNAMHSGDINTACNDIGALINEVQAQSGSALTTAQANQLIALANQIRAALSCP